MAGTAGDADTSKRSAGHEASQSASWETYSSLLEFAGLVRRDLRDLKPLDMIDIQSFIWVQGSEEYDE
jgi:hypothetical protein